MKKTIAAALTFFALTTGVTLAQGVYSRPYDNRPRPNSTRDEWQEELKIDRLDALVGLTNRQERQLHRIEDQYDQHMARVRMSPASLRELKARKNQEMLSVLTQNQREKLIAAQQYGRRGTFAPYGRRC